MKNKLSYIIIIIFYFSCGNVETPIEKNNETSTTSEINEDHSLEKIATEQPDWLKEIIRKKTEEIQEIQDGFGHYKIRKYSKINNSLSYSITSAFIDGVCNRDTLATYIDGEKIDQISVQFTCDADMTAPEYKWTEYDSVSARSFRIRTYREYAIDASLIGPDGFLKDHILDEVDTKIDSTITVVRIEDNGKITEQK